MRACSTFIFSVPMLMTECVVRSRMPAGGRGRLRHLLQLEPAVWYCAICFTLSCQTPIGSPVNSWNR